MKKYLVSLVGAALVLSACSSDSGPLVTEGPAATEAPVTTAAPESDAPVVTEAVVTGPRAFTVADGSEVSFEISEVLNGDDKRVLGKTTDLSGSVTFDPSDPNGASDGIIVVQAASLSTDADRRNGTIRRFILDTADFPEITFSMTSISGAETGTVTISGDLTVRDITIPVTFEMAVLESSDSRVVLEGSAVVTRDSLDLNIPSVPFVANVQDEVTLNATLVFES
jgi:polyisoprenoid-binding protein YceI